MLDSVHVADCNLMTLYLIVCNPTANVYNVTKSVKSLRSLRVSTKWVALQLLVQMRVIWMEMYKCGMVAMLLLGFDSINFYGISDHTQHSKANKKSNNHAILYGFCASSFNASHDFNGVHCPNVKSNISGCPHIGSQLIAMSQATDKSH